MRIISGKYRGKKLKEFELDSTKPTTDRVKESIFNLIQFEVQEAKVLDLFAGTGALGIEALSRGAKKVVFVDNNEKAIKIINENLNNIQGDFEVKKLDYIKFLESNKDKFDLIFLDPPYFTECGISAINLIVEKDCLSENGIIIFETSDEKSFEFKHECFEIKRKKYGTINVYKLEKIR